MLHVTEEARDAIRRALARANPARDALRVRVGVTNGRFDYHLSGIGREEITPSDVVVEGQGFSLVLDEDSAARLRGATMDWRETLLESGFRFDNPNQPATAVLPQGPRDDITGPLPERVRLLLDAEINPAIAAHGGRVSLVDVRDGRVYLAFGGGCHGCGMVDVTLRQGIETRLREVLPEILEVVDTTDHAAGEKPYYTPL